MNLREYINHSGEGASVSGPLESYIAAVHKIGSFRSLLPSGTSLAEICSGGEAGEILKQCGLRIHRVTERRGMPECSRVAKCWSREASYS